MNASGLRYGTLDKGMQHTSKQFYTMHSCNNFRLISYSHARTSPHLSILSHTSALDDD